MMKLMPDADNDTNYVESIHTKIKKRSGLKRLTSLNTYIHLYFLNHKYNLYQNTYYQSNVTNCTIVLLNVLKLIST